MEVGDLVHMPGSVIPNGGSPEHPEEGAGVGLIVGMPEDGVVRGRHRSKRIHVLWFDEMETCWEPMKWLKVLK